MKNRVEHLGGSYVDAVPSGEYAVLFFNSHIQTHLGRIELPPNDGPLYHRITTVGGFKIAGQAQASVGTWEWSAGMWDRLGPACGVSPVIYDLDGHLHISDCSIGSQGYRYAAPDGRLVTGDQTYGSSVGLSEWSMAGDLMIGQGHSGGGVKVWDGSKLRVLEDGDCRFIRVQVDGDAVAVSFLKPDRAVIIQTTMAELRKLPIVSAPPPVVPSPPVHPPTPEPPSMNNYVPQAPDLTALIEQAARDYPVEWAEAYEYDGHERTDRFVKIVAAKAHAVDARFGLNGKRGGDTLSLDVLAFTNPTVPASCGGVELRDFIYDDGRPGNGQHRVVWADATIVPGMRPDLPDGVKGKWIQPPPLAGQPPAPGPTQPPAPAPPQPQPAPPVHAARVPYDTGLVFIDQLNRALKGTRLATEQPNCSALDMFPIRTTYHMLYRYFFEHEQYPDAALLNEAVQRANGTWTD